MKPALLTFFWLTIGILNAQVGVISPEIPIKRDQIMLLTPGDNTVMGMFDQDSLSEWFPGWGAVYPAQALTDLGGTYIITKVRLRNHSGSHKLIIYGGNDPFTLSKVLETTVSQYESWTDIVVNTKAKFLQFELPEQKCGSPVSVKLYGYKSTAVGDEANLNNPNNGTPVVQSNVNGIFGVNSFHWVDPTKQTAFIGLREYLDVEWIEGQEGKYRFNPTGGADGWLDRHYTALKQSGFEVLPCIKGTLPWARSAAYNDPEFKPVFPITANPALPASYLQQAQFYFQYAARYGSTKVDPALLQIDAAPRWTNDSVNVKKSGLGLVKYFECWNEPDKSWKGREGYFTPYEFAAFMSAVADGHCGTLGANLGVKAADPTAKIVMGGLANINLDYVKAMNLWFVTYRPDHSIPVDVYNFHHYSNSMGSQHVAGSYGISPEQDKLREQLKEIKKYVDTYTPGKEIFYSEYGYDSNTGSIQRSPAVGSMNTTEIQGIWNVRTMLEIMASGIDKSYSYLIYDESDSQYDVFSNCGMLTTIAKGNQKKPAFYYINTMKETLKGYKFAADLSTDNAVRKYKFTKDNAVIYAVWLASSTDAKKSISLDLPGLTTAEVITLTHNQLIGTSKSVTISGTLSLEISERPLFIKTGLTTVAVPTPINQAPTANAGADITTVYAPDRSIAIAGSGNDKDGTIASYLWIQLSGPTVTNNNLNAATLSIQSAIPGTYVYKLTVTDNGGLQGTDEVKVLVIEATTVDQPPVANAGADVTSVFSANKTIYLAGSGTDKEGPIVTYAWTKLSGPTATTANFNVATMSLINPAVGTYTYSLTVTDSKGQKATDNVNIVVTASVPVPVPISGPSITSLVLTDADRDVELQTLTPQYTLDLSKYKCTFTFVAKTTSATVKSIEFFWDGSLFKTVHGHPFSFTDNCYPGYVCYNGWWIPKAGQHTLTAIPYSGTNATGTKGKPYTVAISVINSLNGSARNGDESTESIPGIISVTPNPAKDAININLGNSDATSSVSISDVLGRIYYSINESPASVLNLSLEQFNMPSGVYFVSIASTKWEGPKIIRFTKE